MGRSYDDLFTFIQEAGEEDMDAIADFDPGADMSTDAQAAPPADDTGNNGSDTDLPPEMNDGGDDTFNFNMNDEDGGDNNDTTDEAGGDEDTAAEDETDTELGTRTNDILNERLYHRLTDRNSEIENTIEQIQTVLVALPYNTVKEIDRPLNQLKQALAKGQNYAIDKFINAEYGVNLLFFEKLNSCYILIEDTIDGILKKASNAKDTQ